MGESNVAPELSEADQIGLVSVIFCSGTKYCGLVGVEFVTEAGARFLRVKYRSAAAPDLISEVGVRIDGSIAAAAIEATLGVMDVINAKLDRPYLKERLRTITEKRLNMSPAAWALFGPAFERLKHKGIP